MIGLNFITGHSLVCMTRCKPLAILRLTLMALVSVRVVTDQG
jgi:hypothetical protein